ncbi:uncharacterized protein N7484_004328 [Penicillium longicatenatum]|uniref:uncharacterized protein n=1 Tax=Penicillium longicatenatum TaxID=1561947 RepID=UPI002547989A|nr:uncharacterized protein N7484_004328 [Penicillium longicatenatum]KAJ5650605.1 hypothetical protein N7484_004328 [Penicillium longicatenatum]
MPGQIASQVTRLPLTKFSHATTTINHCVPLSWTHVNGDGDLVCILEQVPGGHSIPPRLVLRVARNDGILEQIDLAHFVRMSTAQNKNDQNAKPLFAVVVKSPCLAVKYPQSSMHIRRFQIKFSRNTDYFTALALLSNINCPLTEGSTSMLQPRRSPSSASWTSLQVPQSALKEASTAVASDNDTTIPSFHVPGYTPSGISSVFLPTASNSESNAGYAVAPNPPSSSSSTIYNLVRQSAPIFQNPFELTTTLPPNHHDPSLHSRQKYPENPESRSATAPAFHGDQLDQMLPPRRDLPFLKPSQKRSQKGDAATFTISQIAATSQPQSKASKDEQLFPFMGHKSMSMPPNSQVSDSQSQSQPLVPTQPLLETIQIKSLPSQPQASQSDAYLNLDPVCEQVRSRPGNGSVVSVDIAVGGVDNGNNIVHGKPTQPMMISENQLSTYFGAPTPERIAFLESWMCELIEDDGFMTLCQDVEVTWRRFAFGVRK